MVERALAWDAQSPEFGLHHQNKAKEIKRKEREEGGGKERGNP